MKGWNDWDKQAFIIISSLLSAVFLLFTVWLIWGTK